MADDVLDPDFDPYQTLGVEPDADERELQRAFRKQARWCHPDKDSSDAAARRYYKLNVALELLQDPQRRATFDARRRETLRATQRLREADAQRRELIERLERDERQSAQASPGKSTRPPATGNTLTESECRQEIYDLKAHYRLLPEAYMRVIFPQPAVPSLEVAQRRIATIGLYRDLEYDLQRGVATFIAIGTPARHAIAQLEHEAIKVMYGTESDEELWARKDELLAKLRQQPQPRASTMTT
ncbi:DnaJ-related protein scj1 [Savitreella phatthalungensis]